MRLIVRAAILCCIPLLSAAGAEEASVTQLYQEPGYFEVRVPAGWTKQEQYFGLSPAEKGIFGITLSGPGYGNPVMPTLSAHYYAPDNLMDKTPEKYIRIHSSPAPQNGAPFPGLPAVAGGMIDGLPVKVFGTITWQSSAPRSLDRERLEVWESFVVIPLKSGYYALRYTAAAKSYPEGLAAFEAFIASFKPLKKF